MIFGRKTSVPTPRMLYATLLSATLATLHIVINIRRVVEINRPYYIFAELHGTFIRGTFAYFLVEINRPYYIFAELRGTFIRGLLSWDKSPLLHIRGLLRLLIQFFLILCTFWNLSHSSFILPNHCWLIICKLVLKKTDWFPNDC